jgi:hypothetical protein
MGSLKRFPKCPCARKSGLGVVRQRGIVVFYDNVIVEDQVIVELKVADALSDVHVPRCRNYLRATGKPDFESNPFHPPLFRFIRLKKERLRPRAGIHALCRSTPSHGWRIFAHHDGKRPVSVC